jgi:rhodanese-related sulfurtransferase
MLYYRYLIYLIRPDYSMEPPMTADPIAEIDARTAKSWLDSGDTLLLDVREPDEHAREHIPGARLVPLGQLDPMKLDLRGKRRVIVHCASGARSATAAERLRGAGIGLVANFVGGPAAWRQAGYPVAVDRRAPLPLMRQVQLTAGSLVLTGVLLGLFIHPGFHALAGMVGGGLVFAGATGWCGMAMLLAKLPYNRAA